MVSLILLFYRKVYNYMIDEIINDINDVSDMFYKQKEFMGYDMLYQLIDKLIKFTQILGSKEENKEYNDKLMQCLSQALAALEQKDIILLSDILSYDLVDLLKEIKENTLDI